MARILSIDYGKKRTGLAVTDPLQIIAGGLATVPTSTLLTFLKDYFSHENVEIAAQLCPDSLPADQVLKAVGDRKSVV